LPAQANIWRLSRLLDFGLVSQYITFSGDKNNPWAHPLVSTQANIWRLLRLLDFGLVSQHIRFQVIKITSGLTPGFNTMKFKLTGKDSWTLL